MRKMPIYVASLISALLLPALMQPQLCFGQRGGGGRNAIARPAMLGLTVKDTAPDSPVKGVLVESVEPGGQGAAAGVRPGDIIISLAGETIDSAVMFQKVEMVSQRTAMITMNPRIRDRGVTAPEIEIVVVRGGQTIRLSVGARPGVGKNGPWIGIELRNVPADWGVQGALVTNVSVDSPADEAGLVTGDIIVGYDGKEVRTAADLGNAVLGAGIERPCAVSARRGERTISLNLWGKMRPTGDQAARSIKRRLSDINVLKYAVIDPASRTVTLIGKYDPRYATSGIPYYELLNDALKSPYSWFSLEPTPGTDSAARRVSEAIGSDCSRMFSDPSYCQTYANKLLGLLLNDRELKQDGDQFVRKGAEAFGISDSEMRKVLSKSAGDNSISDDDIIVIVGKVLEGMGYKEVGRAMKSPDDPQNSLVQLGILSPGNEIINKFHSGQISKDEASLQLGTLMLGAMLRWMKAPESDVSSMEKKVLAGRMPMAEMNQYMVDRAMSLIVDGVGMKMFNGLVLSDRVLSKMYNVPTPKMKLVFKDVPADSILGDVMFKADYALKSVCVSPQTKDRLPGFQTEMDYFYQESSARGTRIPGDAGAQIGHRLVPGQVKMRVSPSGTVVAFDNAEVKIIGWVISSEGKRGGGSTAVLIKDLVGGYANYLTARYDELAAVYPVLHRFREAEKLIALARWAKANNYALVVDKAYGARVAQLPEAGGFWQAVFTANSKEFSLNVVSEGGASFAKEEGEAWVQPAVNNEVTADVSKQLVMSTVLADMAAGAAVGGDMEAARDLADKSARAMTGEIDLTQLPSLGQMPAVGDPVGAITLSEEALDAVDQNLRKVEEARISMAKAGEIENAKPEDAAKLRADAEAQTQAAQANLKSLHDALDWARKNPGKTDGTVAKIRGLGQVDQSKLTIPAASPSKPAVVEPAPQPAEPTIASPTTTAKGAITPEERKKWLAELASLEKELETTKAQFLKLNKSIQQDRGQLDDWGKVAADGMDRCRGVLYNLLMDSSAAQLSDRYETMTELAKKLPDNPTEYISKLNRIKNWFKAMTVTQAFKDVADVAAKDGKTLPELLEEVRDDLNIIASVTGADKTVAGAAWKYGTDIVEMSYSFTQFSTAYDNIEQLDKNSDAYLKAVASLTVRMQKLVVRIKEIKASLGQTQAGRP